MVCVLTSYHLSLTDSHSSSTPKQHDDDTFKETITCCHCIRRGEEKERRIVGILNICEYCIIITDITQNITAHL